jgi:hypothetical protein
MKIGHRRGDGADMAAVEFVDREGEIRPATPVDMGTVIRNAGLAALLRVPVARKHEPLAPLRPIPLTVVSSPTAEITEE